jgi:hypothetical protein
MRLPAKNATAPLMAFVFAMTGALDAASQTATEIEPPRTGAATRPAAAPDAQARGADAVPPARDGERALPPPAPRLQHTDAGLRGQFWRGTPFSLLSEALPRLPVRITSPVARALTLEVLTAPTEPVGGPRMAARLAALRAERLYAMGQLVHADAAWGEAALLKGDPARTPAEIETKLLLRGPRAACAAVAEYLAIRSTPYLERATIACQAVAGLHGEAAIGLGLLRERGIAVGEVFAGLITAQQPDLARPFGAFIGADAWAVGLLAETSLPWPEDAMRLGAPALLRAVATNGTGPIAVRIGAAERAFRLGAIDRAALMALYGAARFSDAAMGQAGQLPLSHYTPMKRALLFQAALAAKPGPARIEILANWWRLARADHGEMLAALMTAPMLSDVEPGPDWRENAAAISRVLFHAGELDRALVWYAWLRDASFKDMEATMRLGAIAQLADTGGKGWTTADAAAWLAYQRGQESGARRIALLRALEEGLGEKGRRSRDAGVKGETRTADTFGGRSADRRLADWREIRAAAEAGREGEAILLMLTALGHDGVARAEPQALGAAVGVLALLGRKAEARRLAVEAALANGF